MTIRIRFDTSSELKLMRATYVKKGLCRRAAGERDHCCTVYGKTYRETAADWEGADLHA